MPGHANTAAPPLLDQHQTDLIDAIPPVVTGVDVDNAFERWELLSRKRKASEQGGGRVGQLGGHPVIDRGGGNAAEDLLDCRRDILTRGDFVSLPGAAAAAAAAGEDSRVPTAGSSLDGTLLDEKLRTSSSLEENTRRTTSEGLTSGVNWANNISDDGANRTTAADSNATAAAVPSTASAGLLKSPEGASAIIGGAATPDYLEAYAPPLGTGLTRLCRRAVILLTRSPACPDLVASQKHPAEQRIYDQMGPLLARANMAYGDLHPSVSTSSQGLHIQRLIDVRDDGRDGCWRFCAKFLNLRYLDCVCGHGSQVYAFI